MLKDDAQFESHVHRPASWLQAGTTGRISTTRGFPPFGPYGWYAPYAYAPAYPVGSSLRLQVSPKETEVFINGYYAGTVDDFDGVFQRLHLGQGEHEVALYLPGHRTARQMIYLQPGGSFRIRHTMETLPAGSAPEPRPAPSRLPGLDPQPPQEPRQ